MNPFLISALSSSNLLFKHPYQTALGKNLFALVILSENTWFSNCEQFSVEKKPKSAILIIKFYWKIFEFFLPQIDLSNVIFSSISSKLQFAIKNFRNSLTYYISGLHAPQRGICDDRRLGSCHSPKLFIYFEQVIRNRVWNFSEMRVRAIFRKIWEKNSLLIQKNYFISFYKFKSNDISPLFLQLA